MIAITESPGFITFPEIEHPTIKKLLSFRHLIPGWHYGEGDPIEESVIQEALRLHDQILGLGFFQTDAFPGLEGDVTITAYQGHECFDFTIYPDRTIDYIRECEGKEIDSREGLNFTEAKRVLREIRDRTWKLFDSSISSTMNDIYADSSLGLSISIKEGDLLLIANALPTLDVLSVSTSADITK